MEPASLTISDGPGSDHQVLQKIARKSCREHRGICLFDYLFLLEATATQKR